MTMTTMSQQLQALLARYSLAWLLCLMLPLGFIGFYILRSIYRVTFHPLAKFPGPKLAAISSFWLYMQDRTHHVEPILKELHKTYGTHALRIGPNELHLDDVALYDDIYSMKENYRKYAPFYAGFNAPHTVFAEDYPPAHRVRRKMIGQFFSKQGVAATQDLLDKRMNLLVDKIAKFKDLGPVYLYRAFRCFTVDVVTEYSFGESSNLIEQAKDNKFNPNILHALDMSFLILVNTTYFPLLRNLLQVAPHWLMAKMDPNIGKWVELMVYLDSTRRNFKDGRAKGVKYDRLPIFESLSSLDDKAMMNETIDLTVAGSDTSATTLGVLAHMIIENPEIMKKLVAEIDSVEPDKNGNFPLAKLEQLEYMTACIKEAFRYALPVEGRLPRVVPPPGTGAPPLTVDGKVVPPGAIIGMSATTMHFSEELWGSDVNMYRPERWLGPDAKQLDKNLVTFSKGVRQCLGINLVHAELRIALAKLFSRFTITIDETMTEIETRKMDCFVSSFEGTGVRVIVKDRE